MDKQAAVSIGMPVYNAASYVGEAVESLLAQSHANFELIISDNASTDETLEIIRSYERDDSRVRVLVQQSNVGAIGNFDATLDAAVCDHFMWAAGDDVWSRDWLQEMVKAVAGHERAAFGVIEVVSADGEPVAHPASRRRFDFSGGRTWRRLKYFMEPCVLGKANPIYGLYPTQLLRSRRLVAIEDIHFGVDMVYVYDLLSRVEIVSVPGPILKKRCHQSSAGEGSREDSVSGLQRLVSLFRNFFLSTLYFDVMKRSGPIEKCILTCVLPILLLRTLFTKIRETRSVRSRGRQN